MKRLSVISVVLLAALLAGCKGKQQAAVAETKPLVKTAAATKGDMEQLVSFTGTIQPYVENVICPSAPGRIDAILVEVGDKVKKGQLLVKMDPTNYRQAEVQLSQLETDYQRMLNVFEAQGISQQQVDAQKVQVEISRAVVKDLLTNVELRSPINGVVTGRYYDAGDMFSLAPTASGVTGVLTVMQMDKLKVSVNISEQYFPSVKNGMPAEITLDLFPGEIFPGKVSLIYPAIDPATRTFTVEVTIPNGNMKLRPGMFSRVAINFGVTERVLIPDLSVQKQSGTNEKFVYVIENGVVVRKTVELGRQRGEIIEVLSGLDGTEMVVVAGASRLLNGMEVEVSN